MQYILKRVLAKNAIKIANTYCYLRIARSLRKTKAALTLGDQHKTCKIIKTMLKWVTVCVNKIGNKDLVEAFKKCKMSQADLVDITTKLAPSY